MTVLDVEAPTGARPDGTYLHRAMAAEWTRLWTLRSTWATLVAGSALMLFIGAAAGAGHSGPDPAPIWQAAQVAIVPAQFAFMVVVLLSVTGEYATGAIRSTLQWTPRRAVLFVARSVVPVVSVTLVAVVAAAATDLLAWAMLGSDAEVVPVDIAASLARVALVVAFGGVVAAGIGFFLRSTAGTLTAMFLLILALPVALGNTGVSWLVTVSDHLPGRAIVSVIVVDEVELSAGKITVVMIAWAAAAMIVGYVSLTRRDTV